MSKKIIETDRIDRLILQKLMQDAMTPNNRIAQDIFVSAATVHQRLKRLEQDIIVGSHLKIDVEVLGYNLHAFVAIYLTRANEREDVTERLKYIPEVVRAHVTTGSFGILAELICRDNDHLRDILLQRIERIAGVARAETFLSLERTIDRPLNILHPDDLDD